MSPLPWVTLSIVPLPVIVKLPLLIIVCSLLFVKVTPSKISIVKVLPFGITISSVVLKFKVIVSPLLAALIASVKESKFLSPIETTATTLPLAFCTKSLCKYSEISEL